MSNQFINNEYQLEVWTNKRTDEDKTGIFIDEETLERDSKRREYITNRNFLTRSDTPFVFYFMETVKDLTETLQKDPNNRATYLGYMLILNTYLNREGYLIQYENASKPLNRSDIKRVLKIGSHHTSKAFIDSMLNQGVLLEVKTDKGKGFAVNNQYTLKGSLKDSPDKSKVLRVYSNTLREMYKENTATDFTFIYSLIPYVDFHYNTICFNPYEELNKQSNKSYEERINAMSLNDIADVTGLSKTTAYDKVRDLTFNNEPIFLRIKGGNKQIIVINPEVLARGTFTEDDKVRGYFKIKGK